MLPDDDLDGDIGRLDVVSMALFTQRPPIDD
jgi:hypothetical protein